MDICNRCDSLKRLTGTYGKFVYIVAQSFYFYDLETSGFNPRVARIMQFAGQRTDMDLNPIGDPDNTLIKITPDTLPDPDAILVTGITPQQTLADGITEAEFTKYLMSKVCTSDTIMVGFNNVRFDDEFIRYTLWRNYYDAYEWHWKDGCSRWDMLDVVRMTRALRPHGIEWPFAPDGKPTNRLEYLSSVNKLDHESAHDALSDVNATIALARLINAKQPKLFSYLLGMRDKKKVTALVTDGKPVVYSSGRYPSEYEKTTVAVMVSQHPDKGAALMYDLRVDPDEFINLSAQKLADLWNTWGKDAPYFPVKVLSYNKCPAVAPLAVLDKDSAERIKIDMNIVKANLAKLKKADNFGDKLVEALSINKPKTQTGLVVNEQEVDGLLYDNFVNDSDKTKMRVVRAANPGELSSTVEFIDERLKLLLPLYKARNFPKSLSGEEQEKWEEFRRHRLLDGGEKSRAAKFFQRLTELGAADAQGASESSQRHFLLEELNLYAQAILPFS
jgi:exodeoxyribonuclease-1